DGKLVTDSTYEPQAPPHSLFATATLARDQGTVIVKVVNAGDAPVDMAIHLRGVTRVEPNGIALVLGGEPNATNSVDEPRNVAPRQETIANAASSFPRTFPPHSLTILRLKASTR